MTIRLAMIAAAALIAAPLAAQAQGAKAERYTYRCTGKDGKKYYGSTIPTACLGTPIDQLIGDSPVLRDDYAPVDQLLT